MRIRPDYLPTPREIAEACESIRESWSPAERRRRQVGDQRLIEEQTWMPPRINTGHCMARVRSFATEQTA